MDVSGRHWRLHGGGPIADHSRLPASLGGAHCAIQLFRRRILRLYRMAGVEEHAGYVVAARRNPRNHGRHTQHRIRRSHLARTLRLDRPLESSLSSASQAGDSMNPQIISGAAVQCVLPFEANVGESPVWHPGHQRLYWIDIQGKKIHRFDPRTRNNESFSLPEIVTCIQLHSTGGLILTLKKNFAFFDPNTNRLEKLAGVEDDLPDN